MMLFPYGEVFRDLVLFSFPGMPLLHDERSKVDERRGHVAIFCIFQDIAKKFGPYHDEVIHSPDGHVAVCEYCCILTV